MAVSTNVQDCAHKVALTGVKSVQWNREITPIISQADGDRTGTIVGDGANLISVTVEIEHQGSDLESCLGLANKASLVWKSQDAGAPATLVTHTITDVVMTGIAEATDQANPNSVTLTGRCENGADTYSIS